MSFRVQSAWISLVSTLAVFGFYFWRLSQAVVRGAVDAPDMLWLLGGCIVVTVIIQVALHIVIAARAPKDARLAADERERVVDLKAARTAYAVLSVGVVLAAFSIHAPISAFLVANLALGALVTAEIVRFASQIAYSRGA